MKTGWKIFLIIVGIATVAGLIRYVAFVKYGGLEALLKEEEMILAQKNENQSLLNKY